MNVTFRNEFERHIAAQIARAFGRYCYECHTIRYGLGKTYHPDFVLPNGIIIEAKGAFLPAARRKHLALKKEHPDLDIRFVFQDAKGKLGTAANKRLKGTNASWCRKYGFQYAEGKIPKAWLREPSTPTRQVPA